MAIKDNQVAYGVRVKLNENFEEKCLGDKYLRDEKVLYIDYHGIRNDQKGKYVYVQGGSLMNSGYAYLDQLDLVNPVPERPLYILYGDKETPSKPDLKSGMQGIYDKHKVSLNNMKENRRLEMDRMDDKELQALDFSIQLLAGVLGDMYKLLNDE